MSNPCIHSWDCEWQSPKDVDEALSLSIHNAMEWVLCHKMRLIMRPKSINVVFREIPDEYRSADSDILTKVYGMARSGHVPQEGMSPAEVEIHININQTAEQGCHTLFHEMVHAKQMFEKRLSYSTIGDGIEGQLHMWMGRAFSTRLMPYEEWPWEVEAEKIAREWRKEYLEYAAQAAQNAADKAKRELEENEEVA